MTIITDSKFLSLDPSQMLITRNGISDFYWPVSRLEMESFRDCLQFNMIELISNDIASEEINFDVLRILIYEIIQDMLMVFQVVAVQNRSQQHGRIVRFPDSFRLHSALVSKHDPSPPRFSNWLWQGLKSPNRIVRGLRVLRDLLPFGPYRRKRLFLVNNEKEIVSISTQPFMQCHANQIYNETGKKITLCSFWEWFSVNDRDKRDMSKTPAINGELLDKVLTISKEAFLKHSVVMPEIFEKYFRDWIKKSSIPVRYYYERMLKTPGKLPKKLWYGSTNHLWTRMLRAVVNKQGGHCIAHDHGRGIATCPNRGEHGVVLDLCDEYVSYSVFLSEQFMLLDKDIKKVTVNESLPIFTGRDELFLPPPKAVNNNTYVEDNVLPVESVGKIRVMYLAPQWFGEKIFLNCLPSDVVTIDWQARFLNTLASWDVDVLLKVHPECRFSMPEAISSIEGIEMVNGYIEDCFNDADVFVFDFISSPFRTIVFSGKPMVFIDFGLGSLSDDMRTVLSKRCVIVSGWYDNDNRAQINWQEMKSAFDIAPSIASDRICAKTLFGEAVSN